MSRRGAARVLARWLIGLGLLTGTASLAQAPAPPAAPPDVPSGPASIRGQVVHPTRPEATGGVELLLYALSASGQPGLRAGRSTPDGSFVFEGLSAAQDVAYLVGARFEGVPYPGARIRFAPGETLREVEVRVADVTRDPSALVLDELRLRLDFLGGSLNVTETLSVRNPGPRTVYVPAEARAGARPGVEMRLPEGAGDFRTPLGIPPEGLVREAGVLRWFGPVFAGPQDLEYAYGVPAGAGELVLSREIATAPHRLVVLAAASGPQPEAPGLVDAGETEIDGRPYRRYEGPAPRRRLALSLPVPPASRDASRVSRAEARVILDLDAAVVRVREEHVVEVTGDERVVAAPGARLVHVPVPEGARQLRFSADASSLGLVADPSGGLSLLGPLPPGESTLSLQYELDAGESFGRRFGAAVPLVSIYVADTGDLLLESDRLHRRRPVRTPDRTYAHLEAFEVGAEEQVRLSVRTLPRRASLSQRASLLVFAVLSVGVIGAVVAPLRRSSGAPAVPEGEGESAARRERDALYAALHDLEHDHETDKIEDEDYAAMRDEMRARAVALLRAEKESAQARRDAPPASVEPTCARCGAEVRPEDRFCASCGAPLAAPPESEARA